MIFTHVEFDVPIVVEAQMVNLNGFSIVIRHRQVAFKIFVR